MRVAILSDIHSNWPALKAVAADLGKMNVDRVYCLGDTVGYCAQPRECVDWVKNNTDLVVAGNHEAMFARGQALKNANEYARASSEKNRVVLTEIQLLYLKSLPLVVVDQEIDLTLAHANASCAGSFDYIHDEGEAIEELIKAKTRFTAIGHTHSPRLFFLHEGKKKIEWNKAIDVRDGGKILIDVGSVGQPRDGDCRACYVVLDIEKSKAACCYRRVFYRIDQTVARMRRRDYPKILMERLFLGQ